MINQTISTGTPYNYYYGPNSAQYQYQYQQQLNYYNQYQQQQQQIQSQQPQAQLQPQQQQLLQQPQQQLPVQYQNMYTGSGIAQIGQSYQYPSMPYGYTNANQAQIMNYSPNLQDQNFSYFNAQNWNNQKLTNYPQDSYNSDSRYHQKQAVNQIDYSLPYNQINDIQQFKSDNKSFQQMPALTSLTQIQTPLSQQNSNNLSMSQTHLPYDSKNVFNQSEYDSNPKISKSDFHYNLHNINTHNNNNLNQKTEIGLHSQQQHFNQQNQIHFQNNSNKLLFNKQKESLQLNENSQNPQINNQPNNFYANLNQNTNTRLTRANLQSQENIPEELKKLSFPQPGELKLQKKKIRKRIHDRNTIKNIASMIINHSQTEYSQKIFFLVFKRFKKSKEPKEIKLSNPQLFKTFLNFLSRFKKKLFTFEDLQQKLWSTTEKYKDPYLAEFFAHFLRIISMNFLRQEFVSKIMNSRQMKDITHHLLMKHDILEKLIFLNSSLQ